MLNGNFNIIINNFKKYYKCCKVGFFRKKSETVRTKRDKINFDKREIKLAIQKPLPMSDFFKIWRIWESESSWPRHFNRNGYEMKALKKQPIPLQFTILNMPSDDT